MCSRSVTPTRRIRGVNPLFVRFPRGGEISMWPKRTDPLATELATNRSKVHPGNGLNWDSVGCPGLDPGTLGLMGKKVLTRERIAPPQNQ